MTPIQLIGTDRYCLVHLTQDDRWVHMTLSFRGPYKGGNLVTCSEDLHLAVEGTDELAAGYQLSNWLSGLTSGALYAFRSLKIPRRHVFVSDLQGKLGSGDMNALAYGAAVAVATLSDKTLPTLESGTWTVQTETKETPRNSTSAPSGPSDGVGT